MDRADTHDNANPPPPSADWQKFSSRYELRTIAGIGHNLPQEAPKAFARGILDVAKG